MSCQGSWFPPCVWRTIVLLIPYYSTGGNYQNRRRKFSFWCSGSWQVFCHPSPLWNAHASIPYFHHILLHSWANCLFTIIHSAPFLHTSSGIIVSMNTRVYNLVRKYSLFPHRHVHLQADNFKQRENERTKGHAFWWFFVRLVLRRTFGRSKDFAIAFADHMSTLWGEWQVLLLVAMQHDFLLLFFVLVRVIVICDAPRSF